MRILVVAVFAHITALSVAFAQTTLLVPSSAYPTIQSAIVAAQNGDTVQVGGGTYFENALPISGG